MNFKTLQKKLLASVAAGLLLSGAGSFDDLSASRKSIVPTDESKPKDKRLQAVQGTPSKSSPRRGSIKSSVYSYSKSDTSELTAEDIRRNLEDSHYAFSNLGEFVGTVNAALEEDDEWSFDTKKNIPLADPEQRSSRTKTTRVAICPSFNLKADEEENLLTQAFNSTVLPYVKFVIGKQADAFDAVLAQFKAQSTNSKAKFAKDLEDNDKNPFNLLSVAGYKLFKDPNDLGAAPYEHARLYYPFHEVLDVPLAKTLAAVIAQAIEESKPKEPKKKAAATPKRIAKVRGKSAVEAQKEQEERLRLAAEQKRLEEEAEQERVRLEEEAKAEQERVRLAAEQKRLEEEAEQERVRQEEEAKAEQERVRLAAEKKRLEEEAAEQERIRQAAEQERVRKEEAKQARIRQEKAEQKRLEEEAKQARLLKQQQEKAEQERIRQEKAEQERIRQEKAEQERVRQEKAEQERIRQEKAEQERIRLEAAMEEERVLNTAIDKLLNEKYQALRSFIHQITPDFHIEFRNHLITGQSSYAEIAHSIDEQKSLIANVRQGNFMTDSVMHPQVFLNAASEALQFFKENPEKTKITKGKFKFAVKENKLMVVHNSGKIAPASDVYVEFENNYLREAKSAIQKANEAIAKGENTKNYKAFMGIVNLAQGSSEVSVLLRNALRQERKTPLEFVNESLRAEALRK